MNMGQPIMQPGFNNNMMPNPQLLMQQ